MSLYFGIDLSITSTGLAIWDGREIIHTDRIRTAPKDGSIEERIGFIASGLISAFKMMPPTLIAIEGYAFTMNQRMTMLAELGGVVKHKIWKRAIPFALVSPTTLKLWAAGHGHASKHDMLAAARKYHPDCVSHDIADAIHLARYASAELVEKLGLLT